MERLSKSPKRIKIIRFEGYGPPEVNDCLIFAATRSLSHSHVAMEDGNLIVQGDRLANQVYRQVMTPGLARHDPEQMQSINVIWLHCQDFAIKALSFT